MPAGLLGGPRAVPTIDAYGYDSDASRYIEAVEEADKQRLELGVRVAINDFIVGCKNDQTWLALKSSCILMGARTLSGALVPLAGLSPTNFNFVSGDYSRKTGLKGNASTKYLDTRRSLYADPLNDMHVSIWIGGQTAGVTSAYIGNGSSAAGATNLLYNGLQSVRNRSSTVSSPSSVGVSYTGFFGTSRSSAAGFVTRLNGSTVASSLASELFTISTANFPTFVFARTGGGTTAEVPTDARLSFFSVGTGINLELVNRRLAALVAAIAAAIP
jgi:hypothetical protein